MSSLQRSWRGQANSNSLRRGNVRSALPRFLLPDAQSATKSPSEGKGALDAAGKGDSKRTLAAQQPRATTMKDLTYAHAMYQQEVEESRLWYRWTFERIQESSFGQLQDSLDRYSKNARWLAEVMDGGCTVDTHKDAHSTLEMLDADCEAFISKHRSNNPGDEHLDDDKPQGSEGVAGQDGTADLDLTAMWTNRVPIKKAVAVVEIQDSEKQRLHEMMNQASVVRL